jgi:hypothetical protein
VEPAKPHTKDHPICSSHSPDRFDNLVTQFIEMITNNNNDMADMPKDWEHAEDDEPTLDLDLDKYAQFLLGNPELGLELPKEEGTDSKEQPECYMNLQPPQEALEKLMLKRATPLLGDVTISNAPYETSDEACLCLLRQNDDLKAVNNHLCQKLNQSPDT